MTPFITEIFAKEKLLILRKDSCHEMSIYLVKPILCLKGCPRETDLYVTVIQI
jgi:hypothetical protein